MTEIQKQAILKRVRKLADRTDADELFSQLIDDVEAEALAFMHRTVLPDNLIKSIGDAVIVAYNRLGTEGEASRSEGGESYNFIELPDKVYGPWKSYRLARVSSHAYESEQDSDTES